MHNVIIHIENKLYFIEKMLCFIYTGNTPNCNAITTKKMSQKSK